MIDYILLAEFDDVKGKMIRHAYPSMVTETSYQEQDKKGTKKYSQQIEDKLAEMIIPDTGNDRMIDTVFFMVNKPTVNEIQNNMKQLVKSKTSLWNKIYTQKRQDYLSKHLDTKINCKLSKIIDMEWTPFLP